MKKLVFEKQVEVALIEEVNDGSFVGVLWNSGGKSIIVSSPDKLFRYMSNDVIGISPLSSVKSSVRELIEHTKEIDPSYREAFVFASYRELLNWFSI